jgi:hypothetical protein
VPTRTTLLQPAAPVNPNNLPSLLTLTALEFF